MQRVNARRRRSKLLPVVTNQCWTELPPVFAALASLLLLLRRHGLPFLLFGRVIFRLFLCRLFLNCFRRSIAHSVSLARLRHHS